MIQVFKPLEQFEINQIACNWLLTHTNLTIIFILVQCGILMFIILQSRSNDRVRSSGAWSLGQAELASSNSKSLYNIVDYLYNAIFEFHKDIFWSNARTVKEKTIIPFLMIIFLNILLGNFYGLLPLLDTITATLLLPFFLSLTAYIYIHFVAFNHYGLNFLIFFAPSGVPLILKPFIIIIELISHLIKSISLAVRLFANMFAGHVLLYILGNSVVLAWLSGGLLLLYAVGPYFIFTAIQAMEYLVCFLQSYVFLTLITIYFGSILADH